jgi:histone H3/H4
MPTAPLRPNPVRDFLREHTGTRISADAADIVVELMTQAIAQVADRAVAAAVEAERNTVLGRDIEAGFESWRAEQGPSLHDPTTIHGVLDEISNDGLVELIRLLKADLVR